MQVDYLWAPKYTDLSSNLREYHERVGYAAGARVSYLVFAGFWEDQQAVPEEYLTALDTIRSTAKSVILLSVPRVHTNAFPPWQSRILNQIVLYPFLM